MTRKTKSTRGSKTDPVPTFAEDYLDVDHWPYRWRIEPRDLSPGERMLDVFKPFLFWLLDQGLSRKTLRTDRDHIDALGGEIIRCLDLHPELRKKPIMRVLMESLDEDGGPLMYRRRTEAEQRAFDTTCRKLHRFLTDLKPTSK